MTTEKILKVKVGEVYIDGKTHPVFSTAWKRKSKEGNDFWVIEQQVFVNEININEKREAIPKATL